MSNREDYKMRDFVNFDIILYFNDSAIFSYYSYLLSCIKCSSFSPVRLSLITGNWRVEKKIQRLTRPIFDSIFTAIIVHYCAKLCRAARYEPYCDHETSLIARAFYEVLKTKTTAPRIYRVVIKRHGDLWLSRFIRRYSRLILSGSLSERIFHWFIMYYMYIFSFWILLDLHFAQILCSLPFF